MNRKIIDLFNEMVKDDGFHDTKIPNVKLFKATVPVINCPFLYDNHLVFVLQGDKVVKTQNKTFEYNSKKYIVVPTTLPLDVKTYASTEKPLLTIVISMDKKVIFEIFDMLDFNKKEIKNSDSQGLFTDKVTEDIEDIIYRLIKSLKSKNDSAILGQMLLKELYYRIILGDESMFLHKIFLNTTVEAKILRTIRRIHEGFNNNFDVNTLSRLEDMSVSSFHSHFKNITSYTPRQYIKNLRLTKANEMLSSFNYLVNEVAHNIGYESVSQFSNDYKLYFGYAPKDTPKNF